MDPEERVEGCELIQLVQDNIQWWDLVNMPVPHVAGNFRHLNNYQHLKKYSALQYFYWKNSNTYCWLIYQYFFKMSHYTHNYIMPKLSNE